MSLFYDFAYRSEERCHAVYGKHPDRSISRQFKFSAPEGIQRRKGNFEAPAKDATVNEVMD